MLSWFTACNPACTLHVPCTYSIFDHFQWHCLSRIKLIHISPIQNYWKSSPIGLYNHFIWFQNYKLAKVFGCLLLSPGMPIVYIANTSLFDRHWSEMFCIMFARISKKETLLKHWLAGIASMYLWRSASTKAPSLPGFCGNSFQEPQPQSQCPNSATTGTVLL